ncbi:chemotaxis protein CheW [Paenibacillus sp. MZ04-78.2]|uniref:chemotaxis protein CheW n=1 Tax=Paenibacillus sp. MZ04-78.2 TaxID=2962034 RepID=UPI0020B669E5|nr:chemotaxis protein CheW [Paenibacillus sp. MZ04-78.2]MCP3774887.1 chemotaxis protein CheW [Paenibacillus sp. MZ04-78.2]
MSTVTEQGPFVEIGIGKERYAIHIHEIHEIIKMQEITPIPGGRPNLLGVINLRGKVTPVVSLRSRFGLPEAPFTKSSRIVVIRHEEMMVGLVVDQVFQVTAIDDIQPPPDRAGGAEHPCISGVGRAGAGLAGILKLERILFG